MYTHTKKEIMFTVTVEGPTYKQITVLDKLELADGFLWHSSKQEITGI